LSSGSYTSAAIALVSGSATINVPAGSLAAGSDTLTASYTPDTNSSSIYAIASGTSPVVTVTTPIGTESATVTVTPSATAITNQQSINVTVSVAGGSGQVTPSGTVTLTSGAFSAQQTLSGGTASFAIAAGTLSSGANTLTAAYAGDATYGTSNATSTVTVSQFVITVPAPSQVSPGSDATATVTLSAGSTYSGTMNLTCALTGSPSGAQSLPTCNLNPASVTLASNGSGTSTLTVETTASSTSAQTRPFGQNLWRIGGGGVALAALLMVGIPSRRRRWISMLAGVCVIFIAGAIGCGGGGQGPPPPPPHVIPATSAGNYTFAITGTDASNAQITISTIVTLTVQ
jgi:hypothetical protein